MRISYEWLGDFVDLTGVSPQQVADTLTRVGIEVESVTVIDLSQIVIGRVLTQVKHEKARNDLWIHEVDLGSERRTIIAGRDNAGPGSLVPVARPGTVVPNGKEVRDITIAGVPAQGMMCSAAELLLTDDHSGIMVLESGTPGRPLTDLYPLEAILEAEVNSNRPDCLGHLGVAREVAAALDLPMKREFMPSFLGEAEPTGTSMVRVSVEAPDLCARYIGAVITGVSTGPSPAWLQRRLRSAGVRPISNIVDVTNYVLLEYGQPLHTFDLDRIGGAQVRVRRATGGERLLCLDGVERDLGPEMLVIADAERPVAVAGVIGGEETGVTAGTTSILLEAASFDGPSIRSTARALGLRTEASSRFEKRLPPELALAGARRGCALIAELAGGQVHREWPDVYPQPQLPVSVRVAPARVDATLGIHVPLEDAEAILRRLGFSVEIDDDGSWEVLTPVFRLDVVSPEDVTEEIGRMFGYDRVPATLPGRRQSTWSPASPSLERRLDAVREVFAGAGLSECVTPALIGHRTLEAAGVAGPALRVTNALSEDMDTLRTSLIPSLLQVAQHNRNHGTPRVALFEIARAYLSRGGAMEQPHEPLRAGVLAAAGTTPDEGRMGFMRLRSILDAAALALQTPALSFEPGSAPLFHPGRCARVLLGGAPLGWLGELHPSLSQGQDLAGRWAAFEVDLEPLLAASRPARVRGLPRFPAVLRDLAAVVAGEVPAAAVLATAASAGGDLLESVQAFDEYRGSQVAPGLKSLALALTFRSSDRTLTDSEVEDRMAAIRNALETAHAARFRA